MAVIDFANAAAAVAAGYKEVDLDRGASFTPASRRWTVLLEKQLTGEPAFEANIIIRAIFEADTQVNAQVGCTNALNQERKHRYGADTGTASKGPKGGQHVIDAT